MRAVDYRASLILQLLFFFSNEISLQCRHTSTSSTVDVVQIGSLWEMGTDTAAMKADRRRIGCVGRRLLGVAIASDKRSHAVLHILCRKSH
jgi:hypothetical protein